MKKKDALIIELVQKCTKMECALTYLLEDYSKDKANGYGNDGARTALIMAGMLHEIEKDPSEATQ